MACAMTITLYSLRDLLNLEQQEYINNWRLINFTNFFIFRMQKRDEYKKFKKTFCKKKYVSSAGVPLIEKVNKRSEESGRVQILETLLRDYHLSYYLKKVKDVKTKHKKLVKKYDESNRQDKKNTENTKLNAIIVFIV
ncbi:uncharacterized protein OCT59_001805 [Rhizophagus irregularis]|uniref:Uncharacterized protein n=1 Tax=Rhizophagus irregularis (strain DAOM 181602 / DAOM 197198 / MUCL 43194) TaxID=747089 RepID=U9UIS4_RHIID|nr:hypothetical protein OCT59_001805 [Rhizophagus irregularis]GBC41124.1 hypothetical protein GLOIN_2v1666294 [Rhizophagus irregularis DAOM 181602=DAOM 197198]CAB4399875.1 unnamed protein product [Rhizophagus irregularis]CAB5308586.1 unnamed protein product [Rhizophagus irregularis]CAG8584374.1 18648_t:CDS:2 [Rhizophagus irregularis]